MLKIKKLKISGFKSFPYPKEIEISDGITGVIGPNGCGKSNIFEAIRWVMGETSSKSLRSNSMDEVIFSGTEKLPAKNIAEVSIEIESSGKENDKLLVTRSIQRGIGSFFKINKKEVRAKEITMLFTDSGSGPRSSSIISQGNIDQIINFKPLERKVILEDAAGISGLQSRRRDSELKLVATEKNLERLNDIVQNLEKQMLSLKRQARQAEAYQSLTDKISQNEKYYFYFKWQNYENEIVRSIQKLSVSKEKLKALMLKINTINEKKSVESMSLEESQLKVSNLGRLLNQKRFEKDKLQSKRKNLEIRHKEIIDYIFTFNKDYDSEKRRLKEIKENLSKVQKNLDAMETPNILIKNLKSLKDEEFDIVSKISKLESKLFSEMQLSLGVEFKKDNLKESLYKLKEKKKDVIDEIKNLKYEITIKEKQFKGEKKDAVRKSIDYHEDLILKKESLSKKLESKNITLGLKKEKIRKEIEINSNNLTRYVTELETLKKVSQSINYSKKSIFNLIKIKKGYEKAFYTAINYELDAELKDSKKRWVFSKNMELSRLPDNVQSLVLYADTPSEITSFLSQCGLVETKDEGFEKQKYLKIGQYLVSKNGEIWRWDGLYSEKENEVNKIFEYRNRVLGLDQVILNNRSILDDLEKKKELFSSEIEQNLEKIKSQQQDINNIKVNFETEKKKLLQYEQEQTLKKSLIEKFNEKKKFLEIELSKLTNEINILSDQQKKSIQEFSKKESSEQKQLEDKLSNLKKTLLNTKDGISELNKKILSIEIKSEYWKKYIQENSKRQVESEKQLSNIEFRIESLEKEKITVKKNPEIYADEIKILEQEIDEIDKKNQENILMQDDLRRKLSDLAKEGARIENEKLAVNNNIIRIEENLSFNKDNQITILKEIQNKYKVNPAKLVNSQNLENNQKFDFEDYKYKIEQLKIKRELIGPVNLRAKIEQNEVSKELEDLISEKDDILLAIKKLRNSIQNINIEGKNRLVKAFEKVNSNFSNIFNNLFSGGEAYLKLIGSDDPLQTGIEIFARPPGKKLTSINLLSGGEKALTAISLIFSIFLINPSPICILDEVDAALDDSNVEKFCRILRQIKNQTSTKFLIITHHKTTMSMVDRIYGVTMMQKGISDLVKVDFDQEGSQKV